MNVLHVQFQLFPSAKSVRTHRAFVLPDVQMHEFDVLVQIAIRHEFITANVAGEFLQFEMHAVDVFSSRALFRKFLAANMAFGTFFLLVHGLDVLLQAVLARSLLAAERTNKHRVEIISWFVFHVYSSPMTTVAHFVFEYPVALVAFVRTLSVRIVVILVFSCSSGFLSSWSFDTVHELLVQQEAGHRGVGAVAQVANVSVVSFFVDAIDVRLLRDKKKRQKLQNYNEEAGNEC